MKKYCKYCGEPFETTSGTKVYCDRDHYSTCVVCGQKFKINNKYINDIRRTCSRKCTAKLRKDTCIEKYGGPSPASSKGIQAKMEATMMERYGVTHAAKSKKFQAKAKATNLERYGVEWAMRSEELRQKMVETNLEKYGVEWAVQSEEVQNKIKQTNIERYGVDNVWKSEEIREKARQTYYEKTGYYEPFANPDVIAKSEATWKSKYGTKRPLQSEEVKQHSREVFMEHYGVDNSLKAPEIREKIKATNLKKYGYENVFSSPEIKERIKQTNIERYGAPYFPQTKSWTSQRISDPSKVDDLFEFRADPKKYIETHFDHKPTYKEIWEATGTNEKLTDTLEAHGCLDMVAYVFSYMEREVKEALLNIDPELKLKINTKKIITPYELDLYLPDYKIGIECNPTATHNSSLNMQGKKTDPDPTPKNYHQMKSELCEDKGIFLFHIFGYDWSHKKDVIISMLRNLLNKNQTKIYGRNTVIREISSADSSKFMNTHHRQGNAHASVRLGLYYNDELVSVMTFGKMRNSIGTSHKENTDDSWELVRFCNKQNTSVVGGASKLFKYFINTYKPQEVRSFSDIAHTRGNLYKTLGFQELRRSSAGYMWVNWNTDEAYHRINAQKQNIRKFLHDDTIDIEKYTEVQIMEAYNFVQVYDSGVITWVWRPENR